MNMLSYRELDTVVPFVLDNSLFGTLFISLFPIHVAYMFRIRLFHIVFLSGLVIPLFYFSYSTSIIIAQQQNSTGLSLDIQPQIDEFIPEVTLDKQQVYDLRSMLNKSIELLNHGNVSEAITSLKIVDDQLRILGE